jgi:hypothetical protein
MTGRSEEKFHEPSPFWTVLRVYEDEQFDPHAESGIQIIFGEYYGAVPSEIWELRVNDSPWDDRWLAESIQFNVYPDTPFEGTAGPYVEMYKRYSDLGQSIIIAMPGKLLHGELGQRTHRGLRALFRELWARSHAVNVKSQDQHIALDRDQAEAISRRRLAVAYQRVLIGSPQLVSGETNPEEGGWTLLFVDDSNTQYEVALGVVDRIPATCRIRKK